MLCSNLGSCGCLVAQNFTDLNLYPPVALLEDFGEWSDLLQQLLDRQSLSTGQASGLMQGWLNESVPPVLSGAILMAIQFKGVSAEELVGMARVLQRQASPLSTSRDLLSVPIIDTCGDRKSVV